MVPKSIPCTCTPSPEASTRSLPDMWGHEHGIRKTSAKPSLMHAYPRPHSPFPSTDPAQRPFPHQLKHHADTVEHEERLQTRELRSTSPMAHSCNTPERITLPSLRNSGRRGYPPTLMNGRRNVRCYLRTHKSARLVPRKGPEKGGHMSDSVAGL